MFKLSIHVSNKHLADTLVSLSSISPNVEVSFEGKADPASKNDVDASPAKTQVIKKVAKRRLQRSHKSETGLYGYQAALALIDSYGVPAFTRKDLMAKAESKDISQASLNRALQMQFHAGNLNKVRAGLYQKTTGSWRQAIETNSEGNVSTTSIPADAAVTDDTSSDVLGTGTNSL